MRPAPPSRPRQPSGVLPALLALPLAEAVPAELIRHLHVTAGARRRYRVSPAWTALGGRLVTVELEEAARIAGELRAAGGAAAAASGATLVAAVVLHELMHAVLATVDWYPAVKDELGARLGDRGAIDALTAFARVYPSPTGDAGAEVLTEELALLGLADRNAAFLPLAALFDPGPARADLAPAWEAALAGLAAVPAPISAGEGAGAPRPGSPTASLLDLLTLPLRLHPTSLTAQLAEALRAWGLVLGGGDVGLTTRALRALDLLREQEVRAPGPSGPEGGPPPAWQLFDEEEGEVSYSRDEPWMRSAVIVAKSLPVWFAQLSEWHGTRVERLDDVPDAALADLAADGYDTLWLVGVWERSEASLRIKRHQGIDADLGSAYAVHDHVVAAALGGEEALARLRERAARHGVRLAADMVANHTAVDSRWVEERPEWFVQSSEPPFPGYAFTGPDLSPGRPFAVRLEDGYFAGDDAAVVFERLDRATGERRYLFHGNDGTGLPWNDTAQVDFLHPEARRAVVATVVDVARRFPVLRFDAAMALVRRHVRRLWHPPPGEGGAIPSRSLLAVDPERFDALMPGELWREVVEAVAERAPGTMLLAEAFWLMEETFVKRLGMHRVYHSAFMQLLADGRDGELRRLLEDAQRRDPAVLERFVNYLTTPDEQSARDTFGTGDRYFGVATLLCTLPGTPLFGHGQSEGLAETYGMEYARPRHPERPDEGFRAHHRRVLAPLLRLRERFAGAEGLAFLRLLGDDGVEHEHVHAFGYRPSGGRGATLVLFNHDRGPASGTLVASDGPAWEALGLPLPAVGGRLVGRRHPDGAEVAWHHEDLLGGWRADLGPFEARVVLDLRVEAAAVATLASPARGRRSRPGATDLPVRAAAEARARAPRRGLRRARALRGGGSGGG